MELPEGRSIPAGDPRATQPNPYIAHDWYDSRGNGATAIRTEPLSEQAAWQQRKYGGFPPKRFNRHRPVHNREMETYQANHLYDPDVQEEDVKAVNKSYDDAKRRRTMNIVNAAVARDVSPPRGSPYKRSFIPQDLWHMLSPDE